MKIGVVREIAAGETRVAMTPALMAPLIKAGHEFIVEKSAGAASHFADADYAEAGATIVGSAEEVYSGVEIVFKVQPPQMHPAAGKHEAELIGEGRAFIGFLAPLANRDVIDTCVNRKITAFAMEFVPRITRAQSMDALSSMATVAGYKAVLIAASQLERFFPLLMTAAGTIPPSTVLILGAGVAGLQAIATAKRLGAKVEAFDPRAAVKEQVMSLGAQFVEMEMPEDAETEGGYAKAQSDAFLLKEQEAIGARLPKVDVVVTTAQIFGQAAPILITKAMVESMRPGSIIIDLAAEQGGNCELTEAGKTVVHAGVSVQGAVNLPATVPVHASQMYAKNVSNLFKHLYGAEDGALDFEDEITAGACLTHDGALRNAFLQKAYAEKGES